MLEDVDVNQGAMNTGKEQEKLQTKDEGEC